MTRRQRRRGALSELAVAKAERVKKKKLKESAYEAKNVNPVFVTSHDFRVNFIPDHHISPWSHVHWPHI